MRTPRRAGFAAAAVLLLSAAGGPLSGVPSQACHFFSYFQAASTAEQPLTLWERLTVSLLLAGHEAHGGKSPSPGAESCRS